MKKIISISLIFCLACCDNTVEIPVNAKNIKSIELLYLDSVYNYQSIKKICNKDSIYEIVKLIKKADFEYVKVSCDYNLRICTKDSTFNILLNQEYVKYTGKVYKLDKNIISYMLIDNKVTR